MNKLITTGDWIMRCDISRVSAPPDHFSLTITSQLLSARLPSNRRTQFQ